MYGEQTAKSATNLRFNDFVAGELYKNHESIAFFDVSIYKHLPFLLITIILNLACSRLKEPILAPPLPECVYSEQEATILSQQFIAKSGLNWGSPTRIDYGKGRYTFFYFTPENEMPLLGPRATWVNCTTGETGFVLRF